MATYDIFSIPFSFNENGETTSTLDEANVWQQRVITLLCTRFGERVMRPDFGTNLADALFENETLAAEIAQRTITIAFNKWLPALKLLEIRPKYDYNTGYMELTIFYELPSGVEDAVSINTSIFNRSGDLIQELYNG